jgi:hypothetical protein
MAAHKFASSGVSSRASFHDHPTRAARNPGMTSNTPFPDDEEEAVAEELADAADETPTDLTAPELDPRTEDLTEWDDPPAAHGAAAPKVSPDDEDSIAAQLVYEGTDEAERELRIAAADPDFEP